MIATTTNEAAKRLRTFLMNEGAKDGLTDSMAPLVDAALAAERRATVERIRERLHGHEAPQGNHRYCGPHPEDCLGIDAILDEEAARG